MFKWPEKCQEDFPFEDAHVHDFICNDSFRFQPTFKLGTKISRKLLGFLNEPSHTGTKVFAVYIQALLSLIFTWEVCLTFIFILEHCLLYSNKQRSCRAQLFLNMKYLGYQF